MNIHEHQAKNIKILWSSISNVVIHSISEIRTKINTLKKGKYVLKAQIHAGGRGKAGGVKLVET